MAAPPLPPWHQFRDVLSPQLRGALLAWTLANRARFKPSRIAGAGVDPTQRISEKLVDLGPIRAPLESRLRAMLPEIFKRCGTKPFEVEHVELEIAAHGDGAFFTRHSDIPFGPGRKPLGGDGGGRQDRLVSAVYYYHREPKGFSGGALRLFPLAAGGSGDGFAEAEPEQNSLVVFPSWAPHEVMRVASPSGRFEDCRFAVNAWFCATLG